ncbi:MAG: hypothetical protein HZA93_11120 [Verrucomicrobia bacterium]|nr:hypothetical protein [Verrucomicrobiota bacterium]
MMRAPEFILIVVIALVLLRAGRFAFAATPRTTDRRLTSPEQFALLVVGAGLAAGVGMVVWRLTVR